MEELKRKKRITIGGFAFLAFIIFGFLTIEEPKDVYQLNPQQMNEELVLVHQVTPKEAVDMLKDTVHNVFVDVRSIYDFERGSLDHAINIPIPMFLEESNKHLFDQWEQDSVTVVLYGNDQLQANGPWMLMYQLGYTNTRVLLGGKDYMDKLTNGLLTENSTYEVEDPAVDFKAVIAKGNAGQKSVTIQAPKKKVVVRKKKKKAAEGGC